MVNPRLFTMTPLKRLFILKALGSAHASICWTSLGGALAIDQAYATGRNAVAFDTADPSVGTLYDAELAAKAINPKTQGITYDQLMVFERSHVQAFNDWGDPLMTYNVAHMENRTGLQLLLW